MTKAHFQKIDITQYTDKQTLADTSRIPQNWLPPKAPKAYYPTKGPSKDNHTRFIGAKIPISLFSMIAASPKSISEIINEAVKLYFAVAHHPAIQKQPEAEISTLVRSALDEYWDRHQSNKQNGVGV